MTKSEKLNSVSDCAFNCTSDNAIEDEALELNNEFWEFSLLLWKSEALRECLLTLQDYRSRRVNRVLFALWASVKGQNAETFLSSKIDSLEHWHSQVVAPLRQTRKAIPKHNTLKKLRDKIQEAELNAEQHEQALMYGVSKELLKESELEVIDTLVNNLLASGLDTSDLLLLKEAISNSEQFSFVSMTTLTDKINLLRSP